MRSSLIGCWICLLGLAGPASALRLQLRGVSPGDIAGPAAGGQPLLLANPSLLLRCDPNRLSWSADSTQISVELQAPSLELRLDGESVPWADAELRFEALHARDAELTLLAKVGALRIRGDAAEVEWEPASRGRVAAHVRRGWLLSGLSGALVAGLFLQWRARRHGPGSSPPALHRA